MELELRAMAARDSSRQQLAPVREEALDDQEVTEVKVAEAEAAVVRMKAEHASMAASMAAAQERAVALAKEVAELHGRVPLLEPAAMAEALRDDALQRDVAHLARRRWRWRLRHRRDLALTYQR